MIRKGRVRPMTAKGAIKKAVKTIPTQYETIFKYDVVEKSQIRVGLVAHDNPKDPQIVVEDMTPIQARIFSKLYLDRYLEHDKF
ncbi:MAG: hypothetical protein U9R75_01560 [Candidatus Thermoplasmatota archaeon]|nr:hypothetical protein [Candidatus Thermoplasmatota archaeon]